MGSEALLLFALMCKHAICDLAINHLEHQPTNLNISIKVYTYIH
jgi:hypothetical protein